MRLYIPSWNTVHMRWCPLQDIVLQLEANSAHLFPTSGVSFDHSLKESPTFCVISVFSPLQLIAVWEAL